MHVTFFDRPVSFSDATQSTLKSCKASKANAVRDLEHYGNLKSKLFH